MESCGKYRPFHIGTMESQIGIERSAKMGLLMLMQVIFFQHAIEGTATDS